ncbi:nickel-dependent lactate racemase [Ammoniphilus sp. CFH 90114]|uniref:nickel-dependent lactate racemase n=1 Tax=Ammoniphilus sp. CFH 90114 TaxID=2493665 RepID=UPI00100DEC88|nr:nickel-dependent lactate racemase [Ammoniphilus sp. CFH 90114]RXT08138.1 nickel-dependent lactate racemase [Ammoniphilus sp. CFH 90114]
MNYTIGYGKGSIQFSLPEGTDAHEINYDSESRGEEMDWIRQALENPIESPLLRELAKGKQSAVILISDASRLSPSYKFLPSLLEALREGGLSNAQIRIVVALGMHRKQTERELKQLVGEEIYQSIEVINHSALPEDCVHLGTTALGTPVEIFRPVVEAELRIATGNMEPHGLAGLSGGVKALMPGVSSQRSIQHNHSFSIKWKSQPGNPENPIRKDMEETLKFLPVQFLLNTIVNHRREILHAVGGDVLKAHRTLVEKAKQIFLVPIQKKYDAVIVSTGGHPKDMQLYQAVKTLQNASKVVKPGGRILLVAECKEMFGNGLFQYWVETVQDSSRIAEMMKEQFVLGAHKVSHIDEVLKQHEVYLYSEIPESTAELIGFKPVEDLQACVNQFSQYGSLAIMPFGALTFPVT